MEEDVLAARLPRGTILCSGTSCVPVGPYRFFSYAGDRSEPPHVHVERENNVAKFWLDPVRLQLSGGLRPHEIRRIQRLVEEHEQEFLEAWYENFGD